MPQKNTLKFLIENVVSEVLNEQEKETQEIDMGNSKNDTDSKKDSSDEGELDLDLGGTDTDVDKGSTPSEDDSLETDDGLDDLETDSGSSGGGLNLSGGGGSFSSDDSSGESSADSSTGEDEPEQDDNNPYADGLQPGEILIPEDPIQTVVDQAVKLLDDTGNNQIIYNNVKASIQDYFEDINDAGPIIKSLWDTEDLVLRAVARKLFLFIKGI